MPLSPGPFWLIPSPQVERLTLNPTCTMTELDKTPVKKLPSMQKTRGLPSQRLAGLRTKLHVPVGPIRAALMLQTLLLAAQVGYCRLADVALETTIET